MDDDLVIGLDLGTTRTVSPRGEGLYDAIYSGYLRDVEAGKTLYRERKR